VHGLGMFATRRLEAGTLIVTEDPVLSATFVKKGPLQDVIQGLQLLNHFEELDRSTQVKSRYYRYPSLSA
jgi:hypothetical protein